MTSRRDALWRWWRADTGSAAVEATLVTPLLVLLLLVVAVVIHRGVDARIRVNDVAHQAARAATLERDPAAAQAAAHDAAQVALAQAGLSCSPLTVTAEVGSLEPGSTVRVSLSCRADFAQAAIPGLGSRTISTAVTEVVDTWRADTAPGAAP